MLQLSCSLALASLTQGALVVWLTAPPTYGDAGLAVVTQDVPTGTGTHHGVLLLPAELVAVPVVQAAEFSHGCRRNIGFLDRLGKPSWPGGRTAAPGNMHPPRSPTADRPTRTKGQNHAADAHQLAQTGRAAQAVWRGGGPRLSSV